MPLDGIVILNIKTELNNTILKARIDKIHQPENDEVLIAVRGYGKSCKLLLSASASNPRIHFTNNIKENPAAPPLFCMVMRKHLNNGKIINFEQPDFERILEIHIESMNEMGDLAVKRLIIEIMGRHSNIILVDENSIIVDSVKHVSYDKSSVRQVLPGKKYERPPSQHKINPLNLNRDGFFNQIETAENKKLQEFIYKNFTGISPVIASEICVRAGLDPSQHTSFADTESIENLYNTFYDLIKDVKNENFAPEIIYNSKHKPIEFSSFPLKLYENSVKKQVGSISETLDSYFKEKDMMYRTQQKTQDLRKLLQTHIDRLSKKKDIQIQTLRDIENRNQLKIYGELITANAYAIEKGMTAFTTLNFYEESNPEITILLDSGLTPIENAQRYFKKYNKEKRTYIALQEQMKQNDEELYYLESLLTTLNSPLNENDIGEIRQELFEQGIIKKSPQNNTKQTKTKKSKPLHYISSDGFHIYVGKNNKQNDELTLRFAQPNDIWMHTKNIPGSHVIIRTDNSDNNVVPETTLTEAANLAAFYSKAKDSSLVPVDYTLRKYIKKPSGAKPGMVIYETNKTAYVTPDIELINALTMAE